MKKYTLLILFLLVAVSTFAQGLKTFISHKAYCTNNMQPYIEFTFIVGGNTVQYAQNDQKKFEADVEIQVDMMQNDTLVKQLHYILSSDQFDDTIRAGKPDFADIQNTISKDDNHFEGIIATQSALDFMKANGLRFQGLGFTLTKVELKVPEDTGVKTVNTDANQNGMRYNLAGQPVNDSYKGIVIVKGRKYLQK